MLSSHEFSGTTLKPLHIYCESVATTISTVAVVRNTVNSKQYLGGPAICLYRSEVNSSETDVESHTTHINCTNITTRDTGLYCMSGVLAALAQHDRNAVRQRHTYGRVRCVTGVDAVYRCLVCSVCDVEETTAVVEITNRQLYYRPRHNCVLSRQPEKLSL